MREIPLDGPRPVEPPRHHDVYYKEGVTILVENTLFKVPRCMFELNSPDLAAMLPLPSNGQGAGLTDDAPVHLEHVAATDFERLLVIIYPMQVVYFLPKSVKIEDRMLSRITSDEYPSAVWKAEEWTSVLNLATKWDMKSIRSMAIKNLNTLASSVSRIVLGRKYDIPRWVGEGFMTLCLRVDPLEEEEARELELKDVLGCAAARETIRAKVMILESGTTLFSSARLGNFRVRVGKYEDGMKYMSNAAVRDIVEITFGVVTETPNPT